MDRYNWSILDHSDLRARDAAPKRSNQKVKNWSLSYDGAIDFEETLFVHKSDLIPIIHTSKSVIQDFFEARVIFGIHGLWRQKPPQDFELGEMEAKEYINNSYVEVVTAVCILVVGMLLLIVCLWTLPILGTQNPKLGLITGFVIVFLLVMCEIGIVIVADGWNRYAAVLMVFLQVGGHA